VSAVTATGVQIDDRQIMITRTPVMGHLGHGSLGSWVTWVTGQFTDWSDGSRVTKCDPLSALY